MCRIDDADSLGFWFREPAPRRARKDHTCQDCGRMIAAGEVYTYGCWMDQEWRNGPVDCKMCAHCVAAGRWLRVVCGGHFWPGVLEELQEHWEEEPDLRSAGLGRLLLLGKRRRWNRETGGVDHLEWRHLSGDLVRIEEIDHWVDEALSRVPTSARH